MKPITKIAAILACSAALFSSSAFARENSLRDIAPDYVDAVSIAPQDLDLMGRWRTKICPHVTGLSEDQAQYVADQIARRALEIGLKVRGEGCKANISVFFVVDGTRLANEINKQNPATFQYFPEPYVTTLGRAALNNFMNDYRPIRWWHIGTVTDRAGRTLSGLGARNGAVPRNMGQRLSEAGFDSTFVGVPTNRQAEATRLDKSTRNSFSQVFIIADTLRLGDKPLAEVADLIAFVSLAQVNPQAELENAPSILNLFDKSMPESARPPAMSALDTAYLESLYRIDSSLTGSQQQSHKIAERMKAQLPD